MQICFFDGYRTNNSAFAQSVWNRRSEIKSQSVHCILRFWSHNEQFSLPGSRSEPHFLHIVSGMMSWICHDYPIKELCSDASEVFSVARMFPITLDAYFGGS